MAKDNKGSTMIEVVVGFTLLLILLAGLTKIIDVSTEMYYQSVDVVRNKERFTEELYKKSGASGSTVLERTEYKDDTLQLVLLNTKNAVTIEFTNTKLVYYEMPDTINDALLLEAK